MVLGSVCAQRERSDHARARAHLGTRCHEGLRRTGIAERATGGQRRQRRRRLRGRTRRERHGDGVRTDLVTIWPSKAPRATASWRPATSTGTVRPSSTILRSRRGPVRHREREAGHRPPALGRRGREPAVGSFAFSRSRLRAAGGTSADVARAMSTRPTATLSGRRRARGSRRRRRGSRARTGAASGSRGSE